MSFSVLLPAIQEIISEKATLGRNIYTAIRVSPQPPTVQGADRFVCIHPNDWNPGPSIDNNNALDETFGVGITLTARVSVLPDDQHGTKGMLEAIRGLEPLARKINAVMHNNRYDIIKRANTKMARPIHRLARVADYTVAAESDPGDYTNPDGDAYLSSENKPYGWIDPPFSQFIEPFKYAGNSGYRYTPPGWFINTINNDLSHEGIFLTINYTGARRIQSGFVSEGVY